MILKSIFISALIIAFIAILLPVKILNFYDFTITNILNLRQIRKTEAIFSKDELKQYDGDLNSLGLYLAIMGEVFDVQKGSKHYGPEGGYSIFAGKDASKSFITGKFESDSTDDVSDLNQHELFDLQEWVEFYHSTYEYVGKLNGYFYDGYGLATKSYKIIQDKINLAKEEKKMQKTDEDLYPPCNSEWTQKEGSYVWCTQNSGGVQRSWVGVPRRYFKSDKSKSRCACIRTNGVSSKVSKGSTNTGDLENPNFRPYDGCNKLATRCKVL